MKKHHKERLLRLADLLDTVPARLFDLDGWCRGPAKHKGKIQDAKTPECRTVACAVGWAASDPWFQKKGLSLAFSPSFFNHHRTTGCPRFRGLVDCAAVEEFFGISDDHAEFLFYPAFYKTRDRTQPRTVAKRIREFVAEKSGDSARLGTAE